MNQRQRAFIEHLLDPEVAGNATEAAKRAGYAPKSAHVAASRLLRVDKVRSALAERQKRTEKETGVTVASVLGHLVELAGKAAEVGSYAAAIRAWELCGKHLRMFTDRVEHVDNVQDVTDEELERLRVQFEAKRRDDLDALMRSRPADEESKEQG